MLLDALKDFNWYNEPTNVRFNEEGMVIEAEAETDFWANAAHQFYKDNGHFFYRKISGDFSLTIRCSAELEVAFAQCGIMARIDQRNWVKAAILSSNLSKPQIGTVVTNHGISDWAVTPLVAYQPTLWYRLRRKDGDFILYYSTDGIKFEQIRLFRLLAEQDEIKIGFYAANPDHGEFIANLEMIEVR